MSEQISEHISEQISGEMSEHISGNAAEKTLSLYSAKVGKPLKLVSLPPIKMLKSLGLRPDTRVVIQNRYIFGGPVHLRVADAYCVALGKDVATGITVCEVDNVMNNNNNDSDIDNIEEGKAA